MGWTNSDAILFFCFLRTPTIIVFKNNLTFINSITTIEELETILNISFINSEKVNQTIYFNSEPYVIPDNAFENNQNISVFNSECTSVGSNAFKNSTINSFNGIKCTLLKNNCFEGAQFLTNVFLNLVTHVENQVFLNSSANSNVLGSVFRFRDLIQLGSSILNNGIFDGIVGKNFSLTIPASFMTNNSGNPDGDIQELIDNNTVTITTV